MPLSIYRWKGKVSIVVIEDCALFTGDFYVGREGATYVLWHDVLDPAQMDSGQSPRYFGMVMQRLVERIFGISSRRPRVVFLLSQPSFEVTVRYEVVEAHFSELLVERALTGISQERSISTLFTDRCADHFTQPCNSVTHLSSARKLRTQRSS